MKKCTECGHKFTPLHVNQQQCSPACVMTHWYGLGKGLRSKARARQLSRSIGLRSIGEVRFAAHLDEQKISWEYEPESFDWTPPKRKYTPDFRIKKRKRNGGFMYIEYKGNLKGPDRTKMLNVKAEHPDLDIRLVFEKAQNKINRASKTTYAAWAEQHGFPWAEKEIPEEWRKE